jgi:hypothetical protein
MTELKYDNAAMDVGKSGIDGEGVVMFKGWLGPIGALPGSADTSTINSGPGDTTTGGVADDSASAWADAAEPETVRFYIDPQFLDWLEIRTDDILYQTNAAAHDPEGGSVILVKREARIRRCEAGRAYWFAQHKAETADDPTARWPHPPH